MVMKKPDEIISELSPVEVAILKDILNIEREYQNYKELTKQMESDIAAQIYKKIKERVNNEN